MDKSAIVVGIIVFVIVYWLTTAIDNIHNDVGVKHKYEEMTLIGEDKSPTMFNTLGDEVLVLNNLSIKKKKSLWNSSTLKNEMLELFPHFMEMKDFVADHIEDDGTFKDRLLSNIEKVEFEYVGGGLSGKDARAALLNF